MGPFHPRQHPHTASRHHQHHATVDERVHGPGMPTAPRHENTITGIRRPYDCTYRLADVQPMDSGDDQGPLPMYWPVSGIVRELTGTVISSDESLIASGSPAAMAMIGVTITITDGREDIFKEAAASGNAGPGFTSFHALFGAWGERILTLERIVKNAYAWQVRFRNFAPPTLEATLTPELVCFLDEDPHGVHRQGNRVAVPIGTEVEVYGGRGAPRLIDTSQI